MTVGELREKLAEFPDMYRVALVDASGDEWAIEADLTEEVRGLAFMRVGLVLTTPHVFVEE